MATINKTSTPKKTSKSPVKKQTELKLEGAQIMQGAQDMLETASEKIEELTQKPEVKKAIKTVKKNVKDLQKNPDVKRVVAQVKSTTTQATKKVKDVIDDAGERDDVREVRENISVKGGQLLEKARELIKQGNVRRIIIKDKTGKSIAEFPLTVGVIGAAATFPLVAIGTIAALVTECTITVVREK